MKAGRSPVEDNRQRVDLDRVAAEAHQPAVFGPFYYYYFFFKSCNRTGIYI